jgi:hypothetical protein
MIQIDSLPVSAALLQAAQAVIEQYRASPAVATERALALLALWSADAIAAGRLAPAEADATFTRLFVAIGDMQDGPELSGDTDQLLHEAMTLDDWGTEFSADLDELRRLAFVILRAAG